MVVSSKGARLVLNLLRGSDTMPAKGMRRWTMGQWKGIMKAGNLELSVIVTYRLPDDGMGEWYGSAVTDKPWPINQPQFETNIGTVVIVNQTIRSDGTHYIAFTGSGNPKGPLAKAMGMGE
jgi:hypothetical protein